MERSARHASYRRIESRSFIPRPLYAGGITGLIFALLFLAGFRHEKRILVLWAVMTGFALAFFVPPGLFLPIRIGIASSIAMLVTKLVMLTLIPLSMAYNGIFNKIREFMLPDNHSFL